MGVAFTLSAGFLFSSILLREGNGLLYDCRYSGGNELIVPHRTFLLDGLGTEQVAFAWASAHNLSGRCNFEAFYY